MIQGIKFELKKYVMTKSHFVILFIITFAGMGILFWNEGGYFFEKAMRKDFYSQVGDTFSETDKQKWIEEKEQLEQELYETDADGIISPNQEEMYKKGRYADTKIDDYSLLGELLTCIEVVEKRNRNTLLITDSFEGTSHDYESEDNYMLADREKLSAAAQNMAFGWMPCLALIIILSASFAVEYENNVNPVLCITKKGEWAISMAKILTGILAAVVLNVYFWGVYLIAQTAFLGMTGQDWRQPLFLAEGYQICASGTTIQGFLAKQVLVSILVSVLAAIFTMVLSKVIKKGIYALLAALAVFVATLIPDLLNMMIYSNVYVSEQSNWYLISEPAFYRMLKYEKIFNPVSMIQFQYYAEQPRYIQIFDFQYPLYCFPIILAVLLIGIFSIVLLYEKSGRRK